MNLEMKWASAILGGILLSVTRVHAERVDHGGCYAEWDGQQLLIGNERIERRWKINQGTLTPTSYRDVKSNFEWLRAPGKQPAPFPNAQANGENAQIAFRSIIGKSSPVAEESLTIEMVVSKTAHPYTCRFQVFPDASGVEIAFTDESSIVAPGDAATPLSTTGIEIPVKGPAAKWLTVSDDLTLAPRHLKFTQVELLDQTDGRSQLVFEKSWLPVQEVISEKGNVFFVEDTLTQRGLVYVKLAPSPESRPLKAAWDVRYDGGARRISMAADNYRSVVLAYSDGSAGRIAALQIYQRQLRAYEPNRDGMFTTNTWGDRSRDKRMNEEFLHKEIAAGARLGVDVIQADDGWQKGQSGNSAFGKGAWGSFYAADTKFWEPNPTRFPNGLKPLVEAASSHGMKFGLWFAPDSDDGMKHWSLDAERLLKLSRTEDIQYFKIDAVKMESRQSEINLHNFYQTVLKGTDGKAVFNADVTAGVRPGFFGAPDVGSIFVENRYTDFGNYWPHRTLRTLWELAHYVDPLRLQMEFLNNTRNADKYGDDPLAPARYAPDSLFASVMFANPLGWFENSNLPEDSVVRISKLVAIWKSEREEMFRGSIIPIGQAPDGVEWTGFCSVNQNREDARVLIFRELNDAENWQLELPLLNPKNQKIEVLSGQGSAKFVDGKLQVICPEKLGYLFLKISP